MFNSLRYRLLAWFLAFIFLTAGLVIPANLIYQAREKNIRRVTNELGALHVEFLKDTRAVNDFLLVEPANDDFFTRGFNPDLNLHVNKSATIRKRLDLLLQSRPTRAFGITRELDRLQDEMTSYNQLLDSLVYLVYKRGYSNFGLEGELYEYHSLLDRATGLNNQIYGAMRKIETNYFLGHDTAAVVRFRSLARQLKIDLQAHAASSDVDIASLYDLIDNYTGAFLRLVSLDQEMGIRKNIALKAELNRQINQIEQHFNMLTDRSMSTEKALLDRLSLIYMLSVILIIAVSVIFSYIAARHTAAHLEALTQYVSLLAKNYKNPARPLDLENSAHEVKQLYRGFLNLLSQVRMGEKQREKAVRNAEVTEQRYRELADMLPQSVFETNSLGNYTYVNKAWYQAFAYTPADLEEGLNLIETLITGTDQDILGQGRIENLGFLAVRKDGSRFPVSVYTDDIIRDGHIEGRRGIIIDITDRIDYIKTLQQETSRAKTSDELKSSFLANMSHEIRTPMNSIIGFSNLLASDDIPEVQKKDFVQYIRNSSEILLNLVDDIIDIAKIEAGELKIVKKECEVYGMGRELLSTALELQNKLNKQMLDIWYIPDPGRQELVMKTDPVRLRQILLNLLSNAIKFTDKGSVEFGFRIRDERMLEFYVKDTGVGLSRSELEIIFERFKRTRRSEEKNIVGTGLGLAISRNLVQLLGGEMWVDSIPGQGTTFTFTLPYLKITRLPGDREEIPGYTDNYDWKGKTILVVEDDASSYAFLQEVFLRTGVEILHAIHGKAAVNLFSKTENISLVVMDIQLPGMDGYETMRILRSIRPGVPVIAHTAFAMAADRDRIGQAGFEDYVSKPVDIPRLLAVVNKWLVQSAKGNDKQASSSLQDRPGTDLGYMKN